ncbi:hypothetical protein AK88_05576 [Plasmodium fragile]|uniref:Schizont-infected cell agglutination extracellular alpha domain-containing protein n=1 Tax=Plasmodium fragile TaxID=5857 RepID=A0A0D9QGE9_PLAFR|nr:uncharacterized protein AK88_05576 [Plasmodium fragile]KJP84791.1 hypothetical protein AK88_05576 [Plasmodium fragile]
MWDYLLVLWDDFIENKDNVGVKHDKRFQELFWKNVKHVWENFRTYVQSAPDGIADTFCDPGMKEQSGGEWNVEDKGICEMALIALRFKHGMSAMGVPMNREYKTNDEEKIDLYMRCILTNIFMKKIMGMNCLKRPGGKFAFNLVHGEITNVQVQSVGNVECEWRDAGEGGIRGIRAQDRTLWDIMERWFDRNKMLLRDGDVGVIGDACIVDNTAGKKRKKQEEMALPDLKKKVHENMQSVGEDMEEKVAEILPKVKQCAGSECIKKFLQQKKAAEEAKGKNKGTHAPSNVETGKETGQTRKETTADTIKAEVTAVISRNGDTGGNAGDGGGRGDDVNDDEGEAYRRRQNDDWNKWKEVLEDFKTYMETNKEHMDSYGANCYNVGWDDITVKKEYYMGQKVADVVRCRVMTLALGWANGWGPDNTIGSSGNTDAQERQNMRKCEVANIFGHLLRHKYCPTQQHWRRGVEYSRIEFRNMKSAAEGGIGHVGGPVIDGRCTACGYKGHERLSRAINWQVVDWLLHNAHILDGIDKIDGGEYCNMKWADYTPGKRQENDKNAVDDTKIHKIKQEQETIRTVATNKMDEVQEALEKKIQQKQAQDRTGKDKTSTNTKDTHSPKTPEKEKGKKAEGQSNGKNTEGPTDNRDKKQHDKADQTQTPGASSPSAAVGRADPSGAENGGSQPQAPASPVLPAPPSPPPPPQPPARPAATENAVGTEGAKGETGPTEPKAGSDARPAVPNGDTGEKSAKGENSTVHTHAAGTSNVPQGHGEGCPAEATTPEHLAALEACLDRERTKKSGDTENLDQDVPTRGTWVIHGGVPTSEVSTRISPTIDPTSIVPSGSSGTGKFVYPGNSVVHIGRSTHTPPRAHGARFLTQKKGKQKKKNILGDRGRDTTERGTQKPNDE